MKIKEFILKKREDSKGARDFYISAEAHKDFLTPIQEELNKYSLEMTEIILYSILLSAKNRKNKLGHSTRSGDYSQKNKPTDPPKAVFNITNLDASKLEFLLSVMVDLYGDESIFDYREMIKSLEELAEEGLEILYNKYSQDYLISPSKFIDDIFYGKL